MLGASFVLLIQSLFGFSEGLFVPSSMLVAVVLMCLYLIPFISMRRQVLVVGPDVTDIDAINATGNILAHQWRTPSKPTTLLG
jgi:hypothetical protein